MATPTRTRRGSIARPASSLSADIARIVEKLVLLQEENDRLKAEIAGIHTALSRVNPSPSRSGVRRTAQTVVEPKSPPIIKRKRRPITDPEQLERRRAALAKARLARAEKLAAARGPLDANGTPTYSEEEEDVPVEL